METQVTEETGRKEKKVRFGSTVYTVIYTVLLAPTTEMKCENCPNPIYGLMSVNSIKISIITKKLGLENLVEDEALYRKVEWFLEKLEKDKMKRSQVVKLCEIHIEELKNHPLEKAMKRENL